MSYLSITEIASLFCRKEGVARAVLPPASLREDGCGGVD